MNVKTDDFTSCQAADTHAHMSFCFALKTS